MILQRTVTNRTTLSSNQPTTRESNPPPYCNSAPVAARAFFFYSCIIIKIIIIFEFFVSNGYVLQLYYQTNISSTSKVSNYRVVSNLIPSNLCATGAIQLFNTLSAEHAYSMHARWTYSAECRTCLKAAISFCMSVRLDMFGMHGPCGECRTCPLQPQEIAPVACDFVIRYQ